MAGAANATLAFMTGAMISSFGLVAASALVGFFGYGLSLVLFVLALREIGAARTGAYFFTAPFIGAVVGLIALREPLTGGLIGAGLLMGFGVDLPPHRTAQQGDSLMSALGGKLT